MHSAWRSGNRKCISAGASVPDASWKIMRTPSTVSSCPVRVMSTFGTIRLTVPVEVVWPSPAPMPPRGPRGSAAPYMYPARRAIAVPA
jgi:hypothetical protein